MFELLSDEPQNINADQVIASLNPPILKKSDDKVKPKTVSFPKGEINRHFNEI
jgi:hypothetical protein